MIGGDIPMRLTKADVWRLRKDGFSVSEIAYLAGVDEAVAAGMVVEATPKAEAPTPTFHMEPAEPSPEEEAAELEAERKRKAICRSYSKVLVRRGVIKRLACERCGNPDSEMHHPDYNNPRLVIWFCRPCHMAHHDQEYRQGIKESQAYPQEQAA